MTYDVSHLSHDLQEDGEGSAKPSLSRSVSTDSITGETNPMPYEYVSDDLDKLSTCLSEVSNDSGNEKPASLFYDVIQAQLCLWTCVFTLVYSQVFGQHKKKFILSIIFMVPLVCTTICVISSLLTCIVVIGRVFGAPISYKQILNIQDRLAECEVESNGSSPIRRQRHNSGASEISISSEDRLPKPLCRRHSGSNASLSCSRPSSVNRKLSYAYSHQSAMSDDESS